MPLRCCWGRYCTSPLWVLSSSWIIALSILFLGWWLWRWSISYHSQPSFNGLKQWQGTSGHQKCTEKHPFSWCQRVLWWGKQTAWCGADIHAAKLTPPKAGCILLAAVLRPACSLNGAPKYFEPVSPANWKCRRDNIWEMFGLKRIKVKEKRKAVPRANIAFGVLPALEVSLD